MNFVNALRNPVASALVATCIVLLAAFAQGQPSQSPKTAINPPHLPPTTQYGFSQATAVAPGAKTIYVSGQVGMSKEGPNDFKSQVDRAFENMIVVLKAAGAKPEDAVKITLLVKDHDADKLKILVDKRRSTFGPNPPASALIPVPALYAEGVMFEIDCTAVIKP